MKIIDEIKSAAVEHQKDNQANLMEITKKFV